MIKPELLAPAGDLERLKTAVLYGADAVYIGGEEFSMRTACDNFSSEQLKYGIDFAHKNRRKIYVAANVIMKNNDLDKLYSFSRELAEYGADAVIISDLGAFNVIKEAAPSLDIHISTQANITNYNSARIWHDMGAKRVVLARELSREEIREIREKTSSDLEIEVFVHGAMCVSYSGRCLLSNYMTGRDSNKGDCAQSCRWKYTLMEEKRPGEYIPVVENERGSYFFNSKDLCLIEYIPDLVNCGVSSFKIEGRVKSEYYVASVVKAYRQELDRYLDNPDKYVFNPASLEELCKISHRKYCHGFFAGAASEDAQIYESSSYIRNYDVVGMVTECDSDGNVVIAQRNKFSVGEELEFMPPAGENKIHTITKMTDENDEPIDTAPHATMTVKMSLGFYVPPYTMIRRKRDEALTSE